MKHGLKINVDYSVKISGEGKKFCPLDDDHKKGLKKRRRLYQIQAHTHKKKMEKKFGRKAGFTDSFRR